jgi:superfamily II DNA/RNA helicase
VLVGTVGRLLECVEREYIDPAQCECLIVDEADKFTGAVDHQITKLTNQTECFKAAFSATYQKLEQVFNTEKFKFIDCTERNPELSLIEHQLPHIQTVSVSI